MKENKADYILIFLIVALTGFEFLFRAPIYLQVLILAGLTFYFILKRINFSIDFFLIILPFSIPLIFQAANWHMYQIGLNNVISSLIQFLICYMSLEIIKERFSITFVNFVYFITVISLIFYPTQFFPSLQEHIKNTIGSLVRSIGTSGYPENWRSHTLIFFTYMHNYGQEIITDAVPRNSGAFWEPGMFTVFLNLALLINIYVNKTNLFSRKNIVFIIAIITTFSTTGFIALFLIILSKFFFDRDVTKALLSFPVAIVFIYFSYNYVWSLDFMKEKIESNINVAGEKKSSRFGALVYHITALEKFPLAGVAMKEGMESQKQDYTEREDSANGISLLFFTYGVPAALIIFILFYMGLSRWLDYSGVDNKILHLFFFLIFLLLAFSQDITERYFYRMILFFSICFPASYKRPILKSEFHRPVNEHIN